MSAGKLDTNRLSDRLCSNWRLETRKRYLAAHREAGPNEAPGESRSTGMIAMKFDEVIKRYDARVGELEARYESVSFEDVHPGLRTLLESEISA